MPASIMPLPILSEPVPEDELPPSKRKRFIPDALVVRYGYQRHMAELTCDLDTRPGCGTKLVARTPRGIELAELITTTCKNAGCDSSVNRDQMLDYFRRSGGRDYPFTTQGKILRLATHDDLIEQQQLDARKPEMIRRAREHINALELAMELVEVELLLGGERVVFYYTAEDWVDFRELVKRLASDYQTRIEMYQVNAREEARIVADYEKCGQHCCCRQFLKILKPVSMRSAKVQKATLDPQKISGRCGRLMCCLRYEDQTYEQLRKKLPHRQTPVMTQDGLGVVIGSQILTQLVMVSLEDQRKVQAYPLEDIQILTPAQAEEARRNPPPLPETAPETLEFPASEKSTSQPKPTQEVAPGDSPSESDAVRSYDVSGDNPNPDDATSDGDTKSRKRRRRRRRRGSGGGGDHAEKSSGPNAQVSDETASGSDFTGGTGGTSEAEGNSAGGGKKRRRRRRRRKPRGDGNASSDGQAGPDID